jgi:hypothetical protein
MPDQATRYGTVALRAIAPETLAKKIATYLEGLEPDNIVSISYAFSPFLHRALIVYVDR